MPNQVQPRPHFLSPFPRGKAPAAFRGWKVLPLAVEKMGSPKLLTQDATLELYQRWRSGALGLNPSAVKRALLEVKIEHADEDYFYQYPIDVNYLFSPEWRRDNLASPFGFFRWMLEMDAALRLNLVVGYENRRLAQSAVITARGKVKKLEGSACGYKVMNLSLADILTLNTFLSHFDKQGLIPGFSGNHRQVALAKAAGISNLGHLFSALSHLNHGEGKSWAEVLGYNNINLPAAKLEKLLREIAGENWRKYQGNHQQAALAKAAGISNLGQLFSALSNLNKGEGNSWAKVLEYNRINLPAAKVTLFFAEFIDFIEENALPFISFVRTFQKLAVPACQSRFSEIKNNFSCVKRVVDEHRRTDWPENFYKYLLRTLPFLPSSKDPQKAAQDILEYIEREETKIYQTLKDLPPEKVSYGELRRRFGRYAMPVIKHHGAGLASVRALQRDRTHELFLLDLPLFQMKGVDAVIDTSTLDPLEALLLKEEARKIDVMKKAMRRLPAAEAEIINLLHFQGKSIAEVMHALGVDSEMVNQRFEAALDHLRDLMGEEL